MKTFLVVAALMASMCTAQAQMAGMPMGTPAPAAPATGAPVAPAAMLDSMLTGFERQMVNLAKAMPADKYGFAPSSAIFAPGSPAKYDGVMTFSQSIVHITQGIYGAYSQVSGLKPDIDPKSLTSLKTKEELISALQASFVFAHKATATITPENAMMSTRGNNTRISSIATTIAHNYDHYGQLVEYLRMNGVIPPGSAGADPVK